MMTTETAQSVASHISVVRQERGADNDNLPAWVDDGAAINFDPQALAVTRRDVPEVPGCFILENVLSPSECDQFVHVTEAMGYHTDSPVSLAHHIRHNENVNWIVSEAIDGTIWRRSAPLVAENFRHTIARGINARFRFYRYGVGDYFQFHTDGSWPGSRVRDGSVIDDAYAPWHSAYTYLIFLSDDFDGGRTLFRVSRGVGGSEVSVVGVRTPKGGVLCFPHGSHPLHCLHAGEKIARGQKYIIRTDILFG
jgi:hypothetical protein